MTTEYINDKLKKKITFKHLNWAECDKHDDEVINKIVSKMETLLKIPEDVMIKQDDMPENEESKESHHQKLFYLIAKGRCQVEVTDHFKDRWEDKIVRVL
jgi:hypothetical protein